MKAALLAVVAFVLLCLTYGLSEVTRYETDRDYVVDLLLDEGSVVVPAYLDSSIQKEITVVASSNAVFKFMIGDENIDSDPPKDGIYSRTFRVLPGQEIVLETGLLVDTTVVGERSLIVETVHPPGSTVTGSGFIRFVGLVATAVAFMLSAYFSIRKDN